MAAKLNVWKPTADECKRIRDFTKREVRGLTRMEGGTRINLQNGEIEQSLNIALVTQDEQWTDTDLNDFISWAGFRAGVPLTEDGRAVIDFYCYSREGLETNIAVYYKDGAIVKMGRTGSNRMINF